MRQESEMTIREAAQQALEAMDSKHDMTKAEWRVLHYRAFTALRAALGADTRTCTCHPDDSPPKPCQRKYALSECLDAALAKDAMQRLTDVQQEMDCYGDGNVYRGQRSKDSKTQTITFSKVETVEPVAWMCSDESLCRLGYSEFRRICEGPWNIPVYTAPPKRKPLTKEQLLYVYNKLPNWGMDMDSLPKSLEKFARAIERAHDIGSEK